MEHGAAPDVSGSRSSLTPGYTVSLKKQLALIQMSSALEYNLGQIKLNMYDLSIPILTSDTNPWWPLALWTVVLLQSVILGQIAQFTIQDHSRVGFMHTSPHPTEVYIQTTALMWIIQLLQKLI